MKQHQKLFYYVSFERICLTSFFDLVLLLGLLTVTFWPFFLSANFYPLVIAFIHLMTLGVKTFAIPFNSFLMSSIFSGVHTFRYGSQVEKILRHFSSVLTLMNSYGKCHLKQFFDHSKAFQVSLHPQQFVLLLKFGLCLLVPNRNMEKVLGEVEKEWFLLLYQTGGHSRLMPSRLCDPPEEVVRSFIVSRGGV